MNQRKLPIFSDNNSNQLICLSLRAPGGYVPILLKKTRLFRFTRNDISYRWIWELIFLKATIFISAVALFVGCASIDNSIKEGEYGGTTKVYSINEKQAWEIAKTVFLWEGASVADIEENRAKHYISWPGVMMAIIDPIDEHNTRVISVPAPSPCLPMKDRPTEKDFHSQFSQAMNILKSGKSLPIRPF